MNIAAQEMTWKEIAAGLTKEFMAWGCPYSRKALPEIAMGYECTPLFFWNWMDDPEAPRSENGFLRVLGYAWRKAMQEEEETLLRYEMSREAVLAVIGHLYLSLFTWGNWSLCI